jgi:hypothetical protein
LETRLEKAEQLLRSQYDQQQLADYLDGKSAIPPQGHLSVPVVATVTTSVQGVNLAAETPSTVLRTPDLTSYPTLNSLPTFDFVQHGGNDSLTAVAANQSSPDDSFDLDPVTADDFEWNEQESSWAMGPSGGSGFPQTITDGMASLAVGERRGYLGAVSGAALLRQVLSTDTVSKLELHGNNTTHSSSNAWINRNGSRPDQC